MKWVKILLIWFCIIPAAILNGGFRNYILDKYLPTTVALALSGIILSGLILLITALLLPRIRNLSKKDCIITGLIWMILTVCFEFYFGLSSGADWHELLQAYNPLNGNLWILVVLSTLFAPICVFRKIINKKM